MEIFGKDRNMENKTRTLTKVLIALIVVLLTASPLFAKANPGKKTKPDWHAKKTKQAKLTREKINNILDRIEENRPERAKQLRKLRKKNPEKFRTEFRKIMQEWASKKNQPKKAFANKDKSQQRSQRESMNRRRGQGRGKGQGLRGKGQDRGKGQGLRGKGRHQETGFGHGRKGRGQGKGRGQDLRGKGRHQEMSFDHGRKGKGQGRGRGQGLRGKGRHQETGFGHGQGRKFNRGHGYDRPEHGYNRGSRRWKNHPQW
jgi:hypothetical protein